MNTQQLFDKYVIPSVGRLPLSFVEGKGSWLIEENGEKYLDMYPGWGVNIVGHCHPKVVDAIQKQAAKLLHAPNNYLLPLQGQLAEKIIERSFPGKVFFSNSGAEANEGAMKIARKWGKNKGHGPSPLKLLQQHQTCLALLVQPRPGIFQEQLILTEILLPRWNF